MHRIDSADATTDHKFTEGDPSVPVDATTVTATWLTDVQENICQAIEAAGIPLEKGNGGQLALAIQALIAAHAPQVGLASTTAAGIVERATTEEVAAGLDTERYVCPADLLAALAAGLAGVARLGAVGAYTRQQHNAPVERAGASGSQAVDMNLHQLLSITATAAIAFAAPSNLAVGKTATIMIYAASAYAITWDAAYKANADTPLPTSTLAGKWLVVGFFCHKPGALLLTGIAQEA